MQQGYRQQHRAQPNEPRGGALVPTGAWSDAEDVTAQLARASRVAHLITPTSSVAVLPEGCSVVLSQVVVDADRETYDVGSGKRGLSKTALDRIAAAAGISWDPRECGRIDDGRDPYYCAWRAVGTLKHLDGTEVTIEGCKEMDLRDGSPQIEGLYERYMDALDRHKRNPRGYAPKDPTGQIREMRLHIMAHAESKARLRAIRSIGLRTAYELGELDRPFVVARLMFTGASDDPAIRAEFARMTAESMLGGRRMLYGRELPASSRASAPIDVTPRQASIPAQPRARLAPPPVGTSHFDENDEPRAAAPMRSDSTPAQPSPARDSAEPARQEAPERGRSGAVIPGGDERGTPIEEASDRSLEYWERRIAKGLAEGTSRYPDRDESLVAAMRGELEFRANGGAS